MGSIGQVWVDAIRPPIGTAKLDGRLIAVSNRVSRPTKAATAGGLAQALSEALRGGDGLWVGWSGEYGHAGHADSGFDFETIGDMAFGLLDIDPDTFRGYYEGYANSVLWPVFHGRPDLVARTDGDFSAYSTVNTAFAEAIARTAVPGDTIWVHDYHFLILASALRARGMGGPIGLFLHIPFPQPATFRTLPEARHIVRALAAYDTIGVQTRRDAVRLAETLASVGEGTIVTDRAGFRVLVHGSHVRIKVRPIGTQPREIEASLAKPPPEDVAAYLAFAARKHSLIGIDRLDYSKGIAHRIRGFERYLAADPARAGDTVFTQIAPLSRETVPAYARERAEVEAEAGHLISRFGGLADSPFKLMTKGCDRVGVAHLLRGADAALVTPLADGMNLVAKEYVAAQDPADPGVLILSDMAGAAEDMTDALIIDPHDAEGIAAAIRASRAMPLGERRERHAALMKVVEATRVDRWVAACVADLAAD